MWARNFFWTYFFLSGPFQGGLGGIIYWAALDLRPTALNLRPALQSRVSNLDNYKGVDLRSASRRQRRKVLIGLCALPRIVAMANGQTRSAPRMK